MNPFLKWYLIGAAIALLINLVFMITAHRVRVSNVIGYILNTALSWGCIATFICNLIIDLLNKRGWNKDLWTSKQYRDMQKKILDANKSSKVKPLK